MNGLLEQFWDCSVATETHGLQMMGFEGLTYRGFQRTREQKVRAVSTPTRVQEQKEDQPAPPGYVLQAVQGAAPAPGGGPIQIFVQAPAPASKSTPDRGPGSDDGPGSVEAGPAEAGLDNAPRGQQIPRRGSPPVYRPAEGTGPGPVTVPRGVGDAGRAQGTAARGAGDAGHAQEAVARAGPCASRTVLGQGSRRMTRAVGPAMWGRKNGPIRSRAELTRGRWK